MEIVCLPDFATRSSFGLATAFLRTCELMFGIATAVVSIFQVKDLIRSSPLFANSRVFHTSGLDICVVAFTAVGSSSALLSGVAEVSYFLNKTEFLFELYTKPKRLLSIDVVCLSFWALAIPLLVFVYPQDEAQNFALYEVLTVLCFSNLVFWSLSTSLDCRLYDDSVQTGLNETATTETYIEEHLEQNLVESPSPVTPEDSYSLDLIYEKSAGNGTTLRTYSLLMTPS
ncbi:hypothetical protein V1512DRAFT_264149 [Lipomyces arxii]|uniref:uncharacterized protein n=1 Tax=Lipomyces arxii TaxID=56418 RepID=UPI0034CE9A34